MQLLLLFHLITLLSSATVTRHLWISGDKIDKKISKYPVDILTGKGEDGPEQLDMVTFDARTRWPECDSISVIYDQSECDASWAFASSGSISDRHCIHSGGMFNSILSAQELLTCCTGVLSCGEGCNGGSAFKAWQYWTKHGLPTGGIYGSMDGCKPYTIGSMDNFTYPEYKNHTVSTPACSKSCQDSYPIDLEKDRHFGTSFSYIPNSQYSLQSDLMENGPLTCIFEIYEDFLTYQSGVYVHLDGSKVGHIYVRLVGFGQYEGVPFWTLANSWGPTWAENGTFRVLRGVNECGIEGNCVSGMPRI